MAKLHKYSQLQNHQNGYSKIILVISVPYILIFDNPLLRLENKANINPTCSDVTKILHIQSFITYIEEYNKSNINTPPIDLLIFKAPNNLQGE